MSTRAGRRRDGERGAASVEFVALLPYLVLAAAFTWQILVLAATVTSAEGAARTGSRSASLGRDGEAAAVEALAPWLRDGAVAETGPGPACDDDDGSRGTQVVVCVDVPVLLPGLNLPGLSISRAAELPPA
jgi:hypothetical protein